MRKFTYAPLLLFIGSLAFSFVGRRDSFFSGQAAQQDPKVDRSSKAKRAFPVADFNEPEPDTNSESGRAKKEKRQRYDAFGFVPPKVEPWVAEVVQSPEGYFSFPALPVAESDVVLVAVVSSSEAHLSASKKGVFSEFNLTVESVLKTSSQDIKEGSVITADRIGGYVKYPNGQQVLMRVIGVNMPQVGSRYLLFLRAKWKPDLIIMTGYELSSEGVLPLDLPEQFLTLEGITETELQKRVRDLLTK